LPMRLLAAILAVSILLMPFAAALEGELFSLQESRLFLDPGPGFELVSEGSNLSRGILSHEYALTAGENLTAGYAYLSVADVADRNMRLIDPGSLVRLISAGALESLQDEGVVVVGNWSASGSMGQNVPVHILGRKSSEASGTWDEILAIYPTGHLAVWDLGNHQYAVLISFFDQATTRRIVETLAIRPGPPSPF